MTAVRRAQTMVDAWPACNPYVNNSYTGDITTTYSTAGFMHWLQKASALYMYSQIRHLSRLTDGAWGSKQTRPSPVPDLRMFQQRTFALLYLLAFPIHLLRALSLHHSPFGVKRTNQRPLRAGKTWRRDRMYPTAKNSSSMQN